MSGDDVRPLLPTTVQLLRLNHEAFVEHVHAYAGLMRSERLSRDLAQVYMDAHGMHEAPDAATYERLRQAHAASPSPAADVLYASWIA